MDKGHRYLAPLIKLYTGLLSHKLKKESFDREFTRFAPLNDIFIYSPSINGEKLNFTVDELHASNMVLRSLGYQLHLSQ